MDWWLEHRGQASREGVEDAICALLFNVQGYLHEHLKENVNSGNVAPCPTCNYPDPPYLEWEDTA